MVLDTPANFLEPEANKYTLIYLLVLLPIIPTIFLGIFFPLHWSFGLILLGYGIYPIAHLLEAFLVKNAHFFGM